MVVIIIMKRITNYKQMNTIEQLDRIEQTIGEIKDIIHDMNNQVNEIISTLTETATTTASMREENAKTALKPMTPKRDIPY